jgi:hypothetical protein
MSGTVNSTVGAPVKLNDGGAGDFEQPIADTNAKTNIAYRDIAMLS